MEKTIAVLAGDGIGPEIMTQALRVLDSIASKFGHSFQYIEAPVGGAAWDEHKSHFPASSEEICKQADAILFGSVGGPLEESHLEKWQGCEVNSILAIRKAFGFNANFRPAKVYPQLQEICPLKDSVIGDGVDLLIIRELVGDIYFGEHKLYTEDGVRKALDVAEYDEEKIRNIAHTAFQAARKRRKRLHSVDKANVLSTSKLWRQVVSEVAKEYEDIEYSDILVDNCAMQIIRDPGSFDVVLTPNMFGDILSDAAAVLPGSLGLTPSASLNAQGQGLYEPSGGSAPDIAGKGVANPIAQILSAALMLQFSFNLTEEAAAIENAVDRTLDAGFRTGDIAAANTSPVGTAEFTDQVLQALENT